MLLGKPVKILSYNVVSLKTILTKNILSLIKSNDPDIICLQEIKNISSVIDDFKQKMTNSGYKFQIYNDGEFGTAVLCKFNPLSWEKLYGGRITKVVFSDVVLYNCYVQNAGIGLKFMDKKLKMIDDLRRLMEGNVILCGDMNVVLEDIDIWNNSKAYTKMAGYTPEERKAFHELITEKKLKDVFRSGSRNSKKKEFTYYAYKTGSNKQFFEGKSNRGWRLDYFLTNSELINRMKVSHIKHKGSDHLPVLFEFSGKELVFPEFTTVKWVDRDYTHNGTLHHTRVFRQTKKSEDKPLHFCLDYGNYSYHECFISHQEAEFNYVFMSFPTVDHFWSYYMPLDYKSYYEVIQADTRCRIYFDIDKQLSKYELREICDEIYREFKIGTYRILYSTSGVHIIGDRIFSNNEEIKELVKSKEIEYLDWKVYTKNRLFRLPFSTKRDKNSYLIPINIDGDEVDISKNYDKYFVSCR